MRQIRPEPARCSTAIRLGWLAIAATALPAPLLGQLTSDGSQVWRVGAAPNALLGTALTGDETGRALAAGDFDGNGWDDLAIGAANAVHVVYGTETGLAPIGTQRWAGTGVFGETLATGDFDDDGFDDLAVGAPSGTATGVDGSGAVVVLYGGAAGLSSTGQQIWHQEAPGIADLAELDDVFGASLAAGDFDGDGFGDLAIGIPGEDVFGNMDAGAVQVLYGAASGLVATGSQFLTRGDATPPLLQADDGFGHALAAGDFDGDGFDELAIAIPLDSSVQDDAGSVQVFFGTSTGLVGSRPPPEGGLPQGQNWRQGVALGETQEADDRLGWSLATGDFDGDGFGDLAIGVPFEVRELVGVVGGAHVVYGSAAGLTSTGRTLLENETFEDRFGWSLAAADFDADGFDELAVGAPLRIVAGADGGEVTVFRGGSEGIELDSPQLWSQSSQGIADTVEELDAFGHALVAGRFTANGWGLAIGVPGEDTFTGQVHALYAQDPLVADFEWAPESPTAGMAVQFSDTTVGGPTAWSWSFGDGGTSTAQNPSHTFAGPSAYTVSLVVSRGSASDSISRQVIVGSADATTVRFETAVVTTSEGIELTVRVLKSGSAAGEVRVAVVGGSASEGVDFLLPPATTLAWQAGDASPRELVLEIVDDTFPEVFELVELALVEAVGVELGLPATMTVRIEDDDLAPPVEIEIDATAPADAVVADDGAGRRALVWVEETGLSRVVAQLFGANDQALSQPFLVGTSLGAESLPAVTWTGDGNLLVVWQEEEIAAARTASPSRVAASILGRQFDKNGLPAGPPANLGTSEGAETAPDVGADGEGGGVVTWQDGNRPRGRRLHRGGQPAGDTFEVLEQGGAEGLQVAKAPTGDFVAVWTVAATSGAASAGSVLGRLFDPQGVPKGDPFPIAEDPAAGRPTIDTDGTGGFVVAWESGPPGARRVFGRRHGAQGQPLVPAFPVSRAGADARAPRVDVNAAGDFVVVWEGDAAAPQGAASLAGTSILGRFFTGGQPAGEEVVVAETDADTTPEEPDVSLSNDDQATVVFTRRGGGAERVVSTSIQPVLARTTCGGEPTELCLQQSRFGVRVSWADGGQQTGLGQPVALTSDTGYLWFFAPSNIELVVKVLDGCAINGHFWVFVGGLTDVGVSMVVDDVASGASRTYFKAAGDPFEPILDTAAFATCAVPFAGGAISQESSASDVAPLSRLVSAAAEVSAAHCDAGDLALCLNRQRFLVEAEWASGVASGSGRAIGLTDDTGYFWFFGPSNVELVVKVLDGCGLNDRYWVFAGGLTDTEVRLTITDSDTGVERRYDNVLGRPFAPVRDTDAFATCP